MTIFISIGSKIKIELVSGNKLSVLLSYTTLRKTTYTCYVVSLSHRT